MQLKTCKNYSARYAAQRHKLTFQTERFPHQLDLFHVSISKKKP